MFDKIPFSFVIAVVGAILTMIAYTISAELAGGMGICFAIFTGGRFVYECDQGIG